MIMESNFLRVIMFVLLQSQTVKFLLIKFSFTAQVLLPSLSCIRESIYSSTYEYDVKKSMVRVVGFSAY